MRASVSFTITATEAVPATPAVLPTPMVAAELIILSLASASTDTFWFAFTTAFCAIKAFVFLT